MTRAMISGALAAGLVLAAALCDAQPAPVRTPVPFTPGMPSGPRGVVPTGPTQFFPSVAIPQITNPPTLMLVTPVIAGAYSFGGYGGYWGNGYGYGRSYRHYVIAVKRGYDITWEVYPEAIQTWSRMAAIRAEAASIRSANASLRKDIASLKAEASRLGRELADTSDRSRRPGIEDALGQVRAAIGAKQASFAPDLVGVVAGPFYSDQSLNNYLLRVEREAYETRLRAPAGYVSPAVPAGRADR